jgi:hypothetical protein
MATTEVDVIRREALTIPEKARAVVVKDAATMGKANEIFLIIRGLRKDLNEKMDPIIASAFQTHKKAVALKKETEAPLIAGETWLNGQMTAYHQEQERIRRAEEDRIRKIAIEAEMKRREEEEARKMDEAQALEDAGAKEEAEQLVNEAIQIKEEPVIVEVAPPTTPKVEMNGATVVTNWKFEITNESMIPREYMTPDLVKIGSMVRGSKGKTIIPGVRNIPETKTRSTGR